MSRSTSTLPLGIASVGGLLPEETLLRIASGNGDLPGAKPATYHLAKDETVTDMAERSWTYLRGRYAAFKEQLTDGDPAVGITREYWLGRLFQELGFGHIPRTPAGGLSSDDGEKQFAISHQWQHVPVHQLGWGVRLDTRSKGIPGAADAAPQSLAQEYLNRSAAALWGIVTNGRLLRVLRDSSALAGSAYVEFDLEAIFEGEAFDAFVLVYRVAHASRFEHQGEDAGPASCWLEKWRQEAIDSGARVLDQLRVTVKEAIETLGTGFIQHPDNDALRAALKDRDNTRVTPETLHRALLRTVYRLLFLFVAEDRGVLLDPAASETARDRYTTYFSTDRLRRLAARRHGDRHSDQWKALTLVLDGLGQETARPELGLPALGGIFELSGADHALHGLSLANGHLFHAVRSLSRVRDQKARRIRRVDFKHLGSEELGSVYESLLEFVPKYDDDKGTFELRKLSGNDRKTSGSYYTPSSLVDTLLDSALEPVIDDAVKSGRTPEEQEKALLALTVCDPACGSGPFLVAAGRRIAKRLAFVRTGDPEPSPKAVRHALREVVSKCIYGVDLNPMAVELAKVSLWLEALEPGKPLSFLDAHIKVGNALLGTTPKLLAAGLPDDVFKAIEGDDTKWVTALRRRNKAEREAMEDRKRQLARDGLFFEQGEIVAEAGLRVGNNGLAQLAIAIAQADDDVLAQVHDQETKYKELRESFEYQAAKELADAWCAAFAWTKTPESAPAITTRTLLDLRFAPNNVESLTRTELKALAQQYSFFHWHLEFPEIFGVPKDNNAPGLDERTGWAGGFSCVLGNPPWDTLSPDAREYFGQQVLDIRKLSKAEQNLQIEALLRDVRYNEAWLAHRRRLFVVAQFLKRSGRYFMYAKGNLGKGDFNTYRSFIELALTHAAPGGTVGQVVQSGLYAGANATAIRHYLLSQCLWTAVYGFDNKGGSWFPGVMLENFAAYTARVKVHPTSESRLVAAFGLARPQTLVPDIQERLLTFYHQDISSQDPETFAIPDIRNPRVAELSAQLYRKWPPFGQKVGDMPYRSYCREIDMSDKDGVFSEDLGMPVYEGRMITYFDHRAKVYVSGHGNSSIWREVSFASSEKKIVPQWRVAEEDLSNDILRRTQQYRVGFMDVADPGRQRSFCSTVIPPKVICGHKVPTIIFPGHEWYIPVYIAIANSFVVDFLVRQRTLSKSMTYTILDSLPIARISRGDIRSSWLAERSIALVCTAPEMASFYDEMLEYFPSAGSWRQGQAGIIDELSRECIRAEIEAYVALCIFAISKEQLLMILDSFVQLSEIEHKRWGRYRTKELILEVYDAMAQAMRTGESYKTILVPPPGHGPRHPESSRRSP